MWRRRKVVTKSSVIYSDLSAKRKFAAELYLGSAAFCIGMALALLISVTV